MAKRKSREQQTSKGERRNVRSDITKALRREYMNDSLARIQNQIAAFKKGKKVMVTISNPNSSETNKPFIRVNAKDVWKFNNPYIMKQNLKIGLENQDNIIKGTLDGKSFNVSIVIAWSASLIEFGGSG